MSFYSEKKYLCSVNILIMNYSKLLSVAAVIISLVSCNQAGQNESPEDLCLRLGFAWNLGNHFDSFGFATESTPDSAAYWDGSRPAEDLYKSLAANGVKTVRIPVTWGAWESEGPEYVIDPAFIALVRKNVEWAKDAGLNVILNLHHDEYWLDIYTATFDEAANAAIMHRIERTWAQVAEAFKNEGDYLLFETFNEIHAKTEGLEDWSGQWARSNERSLEIVNDWTELAVRTIRSTGGANARRWIAINGYCGNPGLAMDYLRIPEDRPNRLMLSVHTYSPVDFTLEDRRETWGVGDQKEADEQDIIRLFQQLGERYTSAGIPVYLGEFGCDAHSTAEGEACRLNYLTLVATEARKANIPVIIWDNGQPGAGAEHHAYFDHNDGSVVEGSETIIKTLAGIFSE